MDNQIERTGMSKRISLNLVGQVVSFICSAGISFVLTPYIVSHLGQETYGFVGLANNFTSYITMFTVAINGMLSRYVTVEYSRKEYHNASGYLSTALITQGLLSLFLLVPMLILAGHVESFVNISNNIVPDVRILWGLMFLSFLMGLATTGLNVATYANNRLELSAIVSVLTKIIRAVVLVIAFLFYTPHVWYVGFATILSNTFNIVCNAFLKKRLMPEVKISLCFFNIRYIYNLVIVGIWNALNRLQQVLYTGLDLLLTNLFINSTEMGLLSIAKTVPSMISDLIGTVSGAFDPTMTIAYGKGDMEEFVYQTNVAIKLSGFLCSVPIMGFICYGMNFYSLWMPSLSHGELVKVQILAVLTLLPQVFSVYIFPLYTVNTITCKLKIPVLVSIGIGIANISIVLILLKTTSLGVYAIAGVSSVLWLLRIFLFVPSYAAYNIHVDWKTFYYPLCRGVVNVVALGIIFVVLSHWLYGDSWLKFTFICVFSGAIGYMVSFFVMFSRYERASFFGCFQNIFIKGRKK